jgi:hypothetical protein
VFALRHVATITKDAGYLQNIDRQAKVYDLPAHLPVRVRTQSRHAQAGLETQIDQLVYKLYDLTPEEIAIVEGKG